MSNWTIYYGDGSTYDEMDGPVEDAPCADVQVIVQLHPHCDWVMLHGHDHYWWNGDAWVGGNILGFTDYMMQPGWRKSIFGRTIRREEYEAILARAKEIRGERSAKLKMEWSV